MYFGGRTKCGKVLDDIVLTITSKIYNNVQFKLTNNNAVVSADESESMRLLTTLPSSISIKVSKGGGTPVQMPVRMNNSYCENIYFECLLPHC